MHHVPRWSATVLATHSIRLFPLHFPSRASLCAITFQLSSNSGEHNKFDCDWHNFSREFQSQAGYLWLFLRGLRKVTDGLSLFPYVPMSYIRPRGITRRPRGEFLLNFVSGTFIKLCRLKPSSVKIGEECTG
jgi:hypothetical protein